MPLGLLELKFWAALTAAQPGDYLALLDGAGGGPLCFVAPGARHVAIWSEILARTKGFTEERSARRVANSGKLRLMLVSWEELLAPVAVDVAGSTLQGDLDQLKSLVHDFESAEFRPFLPEDCERQPRSAASPLHRRGSLHPRYSDRATH